MPRRLLSLVIGLAFSSTVWAFDSWPQWQGTNRDGHSPEKGLRDQWKNAPPLIWKAEGLGAGYAGPVVAGGIVCTLGDRNDRTTVIAFSAKDGKEIWARKIADAPYKKSWFTGSKSTPTIDGDRVYALGATGHLVCLKTTTGEIIWEKFYTKDFGGRYRDQGPDGYSESPLVDGDKLICGPGGAEAAMVALDKKTGKELWRCALSADKKLLEDHGNHPGAVNGSPVISHGTGVKQYVQLMAEGLVGIDAQTGKHLWISYRCASHYGICTPIVRGDYVFSPHDGRSEGRSILLKLVRTANGGVEAKEVYALEKGELGTMVGGAVLVGDYLYTNRSGIASPQCMEFLTGKMMWEKKRCPGTGSAAVVYADGNLYFFYENNAMLLVPPTPEKFRLNGQFKIPPSTIEGWSHPAISNGRLYVRGGGVLYCYNLKK